MKIAIIGAGNVGGALGGAWVKSGHDVMFGVRDPSSPKVAALLATMGGRATAGSVAEAAAYGAVVALCTPWNVTEAVVGDARDFAGKILIDCTNPVESDLSGLAVGRTTSGAELVARMGARCPGREGVQHRRFRDHGRPRFRRTGSDNAHRR